VSEPADFELAEAREALDRKQISPLELLESCLQRIEAIDGDLKAWVTLDESRAAELALELTNEVSAGHSRGPLHGIPVGVKDIIDVTELPTTAGSRVLRGNVAECDASVVRRLREAGAVILGKTNTQEFAYGVVTPPTRNPWDSDRIPGGSSGGSAVGVASGMCLGALGTDTAGSIRIPSSLCGISGLKPRNGALPMDGIVPLSPTLDCCGPLARTADDLAMLWNALSHEKVQLRQAEGMRVGVVADLGSGLNVDDLVGTAIDDAVGEFERLGLKVVEVNLPPFTHWDEPRILCLMFEALAAHQEAGWYPQHAADYTEETLGNLRRAESISAASFVMARRRLQGLKERFMQAFDVVDVLILPSTSIPAPRVDELDSIEDAGPRRGVVMAMTRVNGPINWCGVASVSVCCGFTDDGLPLGMQLVARDEATALSTAVAYQEETDFHKARPPLR
jgi:aspartyl-tRNA(Asn)/glutamyl-tRNA(Gln) amidotransferase subunit A